MPDRPLRGLIVEDEVVTLLFLQRTLTDAGYEVSGVASDGEMGITFARETKPDFILMDIQMPGMKGIEATLNIMAERPVPIIILTAYEDPEYMEAAKEAGACGYVVKPVVSTVMLAKIKECIAAFEEGKTVFPDNLEVS